MLKTCGQNWRNQWWDEPWKSSNASVVGMLIRTAPAMGLMLWRCYFLLVVSTHLKNMSQLWWSPQVAVRKIICETTNLCFVLGGRVWASPKSKQIRKKWLVVCPGNSAKIGTSHLVCVHAQTASTASNLVWVHKEGQGIFFCPAFQLNC